MATYYFELIVSDYNQIEKEILISEGFEYNTQGVQEGLQFIDSKQDKKENTPTYKNENSITFFFDQDPQEFITYLSSKYTHLKILLEKKETKDWLSEWKKNFKSFQFSENYWIVPSWEVQPKNVSPIFIDPGMAFGTGTHETTQLSAQLLIKSIKKMNPNNILDVGTGTGVLSIIAFKEGVKSVYANDIDPEAINIAQENFIKNNVIVKIFQKNINQFETLFDVIIANMLIYEIEEVIDLIYNQLISQGVFIVGGLLLEQESEFIEKHKNQFLVLETLRGKEWVSFILKRK